MSNIKLRACQNVLLMSCMCEPQAASLRVLASRLATFHGRSPSFITACPIARASSVSPFVKRLRLSMISWRRGSYAALRSGSFPEYQHRARGKTNALDNAYLRSQTEV